MQNLTVLELHTRTRRDSCRILRDQESPAPCCSAPSAASLAEGSARGPSGSSGLSRSCWGCRSWPPCPLAQFLSLGYFLESSARVARTGRLRDGLIGVRRAATGRRRGRWASCSRSSLVVGGSYAQTAELIDPGGGVAQRWRVGLAIVTALTFVQITSACARGGRLRHFLWPVGMPFWLVRGLRSGGLYAGARDGFWEFVAVAAVAVLLPPGAGRVPGHAGLDCRASQPDRRQRSLPAAGVSGSPDPGLRRAVAAVSPGPLRRRGAASRPSSRYGQFASGSAALRGRLHSPSWCCCWRPFPCTS